MSTSSGRTRAARATASSPVSAVPATAKSGIESRTAVAASRNGDWSSTIITRTWLIRHLLQHQSAGGGRAGRVGWPHISMGHPDPRPTRPRVDMGQVGEPPMLTIQLTPKRSRHMPKLSPHGAFSSGTVTVPPSESFSQ